MRKSKIHLKNRITLFVFTIFLALFAYGIWFVVPYVSFASRSGLMSVLFYPTSALVKTDNGVVTITLYASDTSVFRFDLQKKIITIVRSKTKVGQISKAKGYYVIFSDQDRKGVVEAQSIIAQLTTPKFILGRQRYIDYVDVLDKDLKKNLTVKQLFALWRTYYLNRDKISVITE